MTNTDHLKRKIETAAHSINEKMIPVTKPVKMETGLHEFQPDY